MIIVVDGLLMAMAWIHGGVVDGKSLISMEVLQDIELGIS